VRTRLALFSRGSWSRVVDSRLWHGPAQVASRVEDPWSFPPCFAFYKKTGSHLSRETADQCCLGHGSLSLLRATGWASEISAPIRPKLCSHRSVD
jgi:hypothetical protein